jgi:hypothetical protein
VRGRLGFTLALAACTPAKTKEQPRAIAVDASVAKAKPPPDADASLPKHHDAPDLATAIKEIVGPDVRVLGVGEIHQRVDRPSAARSALARFTDEVLPVFAGRASDLVVETWIPDKNCGGKAEAATQVVEQTMQRPASTKSELASLVDTARAEKIQPHAMRLSCDDWTTVAPPGKEVDYGAMLGIITRELGRIASEATKHSPTRIVLTYGGAMHNDLYPTSGLEDWSFAAAVDAASGGHYEEVDLYVPEYAAEDKLSQGEAWFPLLQDAGPDHVVVIERGPRSYVILLPRSEPAG